MPSELDVINARLEILEARQAVTVAFVRFLVEALISEQPEEHHATLRSSLDQIFEHTIANLLASHEHSDICAQAVESLRAAMLCKRSATELGRG